MKKSASLVALLLGLTVAGCDALDPSAGPATANSDTCPACSGSGTNPPPFQAPPPPPPLPPPSDNDGRG